jgi:transcriptional regulator with XRE-family HTH domain
VLSYSNSGEAFMNKPVVFYKQVGENIRAKRKERGLSQDSLAKAVGLKRPSMSNIEKGRQNILLHTFYDIAETLNSTPDELFPARTQPAPVQMPDLTSLSREVRQFIEAGIKPAQKEDQHGHSKTKNRKPD